MILKQVTIKSIIFSYLFFLSIISHAQENSNEGRLSGNFQTDIQSYKTDSLIGAPEVPEKVLLNAFANFNYVKGHFSAGLRFESYQNALLGFDPRYKGNGIPYRYATYNNYGLEITLGNFYEQFGSGLIFRSYEEKNLGIDNAIEGLRIKATPMEGIVLKGFAGNQRLYFDKGQGILKGIDADITLNTLFPKLKDKKTYVNFGGSFVSKFQQDKDPVYNFPKNVGALAGRININRGKINFYTEYAYKINDPSAVNNYIYKPCDALYISTSYSQKGLGIIISAKRIDNMDFRSDRSATGNDLQINYLPALAKQHLYSASSMYPYSTQTNGEMGLQGELTYNFKKNTKLGGKYGTTVAVNFSKINAIDKNKINDTTEIQQNGTLGYESDFFKIGKVEYFQDFNISISKKINKRIKSQLMYMNELYNIAVVEGHPGAGSLRAHIAIGDLSYKLNDNNSIRGELQYLTTKADNKDWAMMLIEYNLKSIWFFALADQYNFGNSIPDKRIHYFNVSAGFVKNANRISVTYGKQREGVVCIGGVCRNVPATNGLLVTITSSF